MPKLSPYQQQKRQELQKKAFQLYKQGLTTREVGRALGKSYEWVRTAVLALSSDKKSKQ
jgi:transposase-like protein